MSPPEERGGAKTRDLSAAWLRVPARVRASVFIFAVCLLAYLLVLVLVPRYKGATTTQGDEPHYLVITESIIRDGDVFLDNNYDEKQYERYFEGDIMMRHITGGRNGEWVSTHPMATSLLVLPGFWLFGYRGAALTMILLTCCAAALTFALADRFVSRRVAAVAVLFSFLTYPLVFYSRLIYPETPAVFLVALGTWSSWRLKESGKRMYAALAGLSAGCIALFHPKFAAISLGMFLLFLIVRPSRDLKTLAWWLLPAAAPAVLLVVLTGVTYGPNLVKGLTASGGSKFQGGYWGRNSVRGIPGMYFDRAWGFFIFAPAYMLFPVGLSLQRDRREWERWWVFFPAVIILHTLALGLFQSWNGGAAPVQRYLVPLAPLFVICVALLIERCRHPLVYASAVALALLQVVTTVWAFRFFVGTYGMENMTDNIFLPHFLANGFVTRLLRLLFPLYHHSSTRMVVMTGFWIAVFAAAIWLARRYYMRAGGGKLSPITDIRPFERLEPGEEG